MKKHIIIFLLVFLLTLNLIYSADEKNLYDNKLWEGISVDILVKELKADAEKVGLKNFNAQVRGKSIAIIYRDIMFKPDSPELTDETKVKLTILVKILKKFAGKTLFIEGHTAKVVGEEALGLILSKQRADAVAEFMASTEIFKNNKFLTKGYGDTQPVSQTDLSLNRRVEISIVDRLEDKIEEKTNDNEEGKNAWWKTLTDEKDPGYTVIVLKNELNNKDEIIKLLNLKNLDYKIHEKDNDLIIILENIKFKENSNEIDDASKEYIKLFLDILNKYKDIIIRISGIKDNDLEQAIIKQYNVALYIYNNYKTLKPEYIYYSYNGESLNKDKEKNNNEKDYYIDSYKNTYIININKDKIIYAWLVNGTDYDQHGLVWESNDESILSVLGSGKSVIMSSNKTGDCTIKITHKLAKEPYLIFVKVVDNDENVFKFSRLVESVDFSVIETNPLGRFREFSLAGLGIGFMISLKIPWLEKIPFASRLRISVETNGLYHFPEITSSVEAIWEFSWDIGLGIKFVDITYFGFLLKTKYGGVLHFLTATRQGYGYVCGQPFYDQTLSIESEFEFKTKKRTEKDKFIISVFITPGYRLFFDKDYLGHNIYGKTGVRFNF